ncbi:hypothetical protein K435DRAFT_573176, partial [Dendrothele bispora CBS 962.96]
DPLEDWLLTGPVEMDGGVDDNPLKWWCLQRASPLRTYDGALCRMAIDLFTIPGMFIFSIDILYRELNFSRGGLMVTKHRHNLKDVSIRAAMKIGSWHDHGLLDRPQLIKSFNDL